MVKIGMAIRAQLTTVPRHQSPRFVPEEQNPRAAERRSFSERFQHPLTSSLDFCAEVMNFDRACGGARSVMKLGIDSVFDGGG